MENGLIKKLNQRSPIGHLDQIEMYTGIGYQYEFLKNLREISRYNPHYCRLFLKQYIKILDQNHIDLIDELYEFYVQPEILNSKELMPHEYDVLTYTYETFQLKIQENPRLISGHSTTGFRTWEAAIYLSNYLINKPLNGKVLELGCGTGLVSMALIKSGEIKSATITDGSLQVFNNLQASLSLNQLNTNDNIECRQFIWGQDDPIDVDYLVGADITYDTSILQELSITIKQFFDLSTKAAYIAATVRNFDTINNWETILSDNFDWKVADKCQQPEKLNGNYTYNPGTPEIRIYEIRKRITNHHII